MTRNARRRRHAAIAAVVAIVVGLHASLWWALGTSARASRSREPARSILLTVSRLAAPTPATTKVTVPDTGGSMPKRSASQAPTWHAPAVSSPVLDAPIAAPLANGDSAPAAASAPAPALDLQWRPATGARQNAARNPALDDPRATIARAGAGERMARALGSDDRLTEELRPDGTVRLRRGATCLDLAESRAAQLFAFDRATQPLPRQAASCD